MNLSSSNYLLIITALLGLWFSSCNTDSGNSTSGSFQKISGETMGTTYHITYLDSLERDFKSVVDSLLIAVNNEVSTYITTSYISKFNHSSEGLPIIGDNGEVIAGHFLANFSKAKEIYKKTSGSFDPTVMPLVNFWGFGYSERFEVTSVDTSKVDSIMKNFIGFDKITIIKKNGTRFLDKPSAGIELDFSALAKGYGVDVVGLLLEKYGILNYLVEIGGEVRTRGKNPGGMDWVLGINSPKENAPLDEFQTKVALSNMSLATSGNYRNYYKVDSLIFSHTINPKSGFPERSNLLSASVFAKDCMTADALATACMVMGLEESIDLISVQPDIHAYFIFVDSTGNLKTTYTPGTEILLKN